MDQITKVTFIIKNQLDGTTVQSHAEHLRLAKRDWEIPQDTRNRALRKPAYVVPPDTESDSDSNSKDEAPLTIIIKKYRRHRGNGSSDEEHIYHLPNYLVALNNNKNLENQQKLKKKLDLD